VTRAELLDALDSTIWDGRATGFDENAFDED
jgi:hypothetical protein